MATGHTNSVRTPASSYGVRTRPVRTPREFVRRSYGAVLLRPQRMLTPYELRRVRTESVRTPAEFVHSSNGALFPRPQLIRTPYELVGMRTGSVRTPYELLCVRTESVRGPYELPGSSYGHLGSPHGVRMGPYSCGHSTYELRTNSGESVRSWHAARTN